MRLPSLVRLAVLAAALIPSASALFKDEVDQVDFHHRLIGIPGSDSTQFASSKNSDVIVTLSDLHIVAAVSVSDGSIVWRHDLAVEEAIEKSRLAIAPSGEVAISGAGRKVDAWDINTGRNSWGHVIQGSVVDVAIGGSEGKSEATFALTENDGVHSLTHFSSASGDILSQVVIDTARSLRRLAAVDGKVYAVAISESEVEVITFDPSVGKVTDTFVISSQGNGSPNILFVGQSTTAPILVWSHGGSSNIYVNHLGSHAKTDLKLPSTSLQVEVHATTDSTGNIFAVFHTRSRSGNSAVAYQISGNAVKKLHELESLTGRGTFDAQSLDGVAYFVRMTDSDVLLLNANTAEVLNSWPISFATPKTIVHGVSKIQKSAEGSLSVLFSAVTGDQDWSILRNGFEFWSRSEGLSSSIATIFLNDRKSRDVLRALDEEAHTGPIQAYLHRLVRHLGELQYLPQYLQTLPDRILDAIYSTESAASVATFGFGKTLVVATSRGRLYALDTGSHGKPIWGKQLTAYVPGHKWEILGLYHDEERNHIIITEKSGLTIVVGASTGDFIQTLPPQTREPLQSTLFFPNTSSIVSVGVDGKVFIPKEVAIDATFVVKTPEGGLSGVVVKPDGTQSISWTFLPPQGTSLTGVYTRPEHDPVASIGRVLGDRTVLYKYLNPNTAIVTLYNSSDRSLTTVVIDTVSGATLHSATHTGVASDQPTECMFSENWYACTFFATYVVSDGSGRTLTGQHLVMTDLYESELPNDRGIYESDSESSSLGTNPIPNSVALPYAVSQAFIISSRLSELSVSQTLQGIATRQLVAYAPDLKAVFGLPRSLFDPRRPVGRDPTPGEMEAEGVPRYAANVELDPKATISHAREIFGIKGISTGTTGMESTGLVAAYGTDLYFSRISPSGRFDILGAAFDRVSLVGTCVALFAAVLVLKPVVLGKSIDSVWKMVV